MIPQAKSTNTQGCAGSTGTKQLSILQYMSVSNYTSTSTKSNTSTSETPKSSQTYNPMALTSGTSIIPETSNPDRSSLCQSSVTNRTDHVFSAAPLELSHTLGRPQYDNSNQSKQSTIIHYFTPPQLNNRTIPMSPQKSAYLPCRRAKGTNLSDAFSSVTFNSLPSTTPSNTNIPKWRQVPLTQYFRINPVEQQPLPKPSAHATLPDTSTKDKKPRSV
jgi:hypothetical protein